MNLTRGGAMAVIVSVALHVAVAAAAALAFARAPSLPFAVSVVEVAVVQQAPPDAPPPAPRGAPGTRSAEAAATVADEAPASADLSTNETANADAASAPIAGAVTAVGAGDVLDPYAARVWSRIAAHRPRGVRGAGDARVVFGLDRAGRVRFARVASSSGSPAFDRACIAAIRAAAPYPTPPAVLSEADLVFEAPMLNQRGG